MSRMKARGKVVKEDDSSLEIESLILPISGFFGPAIELRFAISCKTSEDVPL